MVGEWTNFHMYIPTSSLMQASAVVVGNLQYIVTICWTGVQISFGGPQRNIQN